METYHNSGISLQEEMDTIAVQQPQDPTVRADFTSSQGPACAKQKARTTSVMSPPLE